MFKARAVPLIIQIMKNVKNRSKFHEKKAVLHFLAMNGKLWVPLHFSTAHYSQVQTSTAQYNPVLPTLANYSQVQPSTAHYSPLQPTSAQYSKVKQSTAHYSPQQLSTPCVWNFFIVSY